MTTALRQRLILVVAACGLDCALLPGCQSLGPASALPGLASLHEDRQLAKLAENDPFPTPSDVGIEDDF